MALKDKKGLWIGLAAAVVVIAVACVLVFVVFQDQIFGEASGPEQTIQGNGTEESAPTVHRMG